MTVRVSRSRFLRQSNLQAERMKLVAKLRDANGDEKKPFYGAGPGAKGAFQSNVKQYFYDLNKFPVRFSADE